MIVVILGISVVRRGAVLQIVYITKSSGCLVMINILPRSLNRDKCTAVLSVRRHSRGQRLSRDVLITVKYSHLLRLELFTSCTILLSLHLGRDFLHRVRCTRYSDTAAVIV